MEPFVGQIELFSCSYAPQGWAFCQGQLLPVANYPELFSLIKTKFGGDGKTNFALPNIKPPCNGVNYCIALVGDFPTPT